MQPKNLLAVCLAFLFSASLVLAQATSAKTTDTKTTTTGTTGKATGKATDTKTTTTGTTGKTTDTKGKVTDTKGKTTDPKTTTTDTKGKTTDTKGTTTDTKGKTTDTKTKTTDTKGKTTDTKGKTTDTKPKTTVVPPKPPVTAVKKETLTLEKIFPKRNLFGPAAHNMKFSFDGKYAAYLYRTYAERRHGSDLWVLDLATGKTHRVTSAAIMAKYQASARKVKEDREKKWKAAMGAKGAGSLTDVLSLFSSSGGAREMSGSQMVTKNDARDAGAPRYSGVFSFTWSPTANELLFVSEADIYQWKVGDKEPARLTRTKSFKYSVQYMHDGKGYTYLAGQGALMQVRFSSHLFEQIDPQVPDGNPMREYKISPDGKRLVFITYKYGQAPTPTRKVSIASYRDRFMRVHEVYRHVSEDPMPPGEVNVYLYDLGDSMIENGTVSPIFQDKITGPRDIISTPEWSLDSRRVAFAVYQQSTGQVRILQAEIAPEPKGGAKRDKAKPAKVVYKFLHSGGPNSPGMFHPRFLDDNRRLALITEVSGFRHLHVLDPLYESLDQVTFGRYEVYPIALSKDRKAFYVAATKEHSSCRDVYRVTLDDRKMVRLTRLCGVYDQVAVSPDGKHLLANFKRFGALRELVRIQTADGSQKPLTNSHALSTCKLTDVRPEFFTFKNRHGHEIHGYLFKPDKWTKTDKRPLLIYVYGGPLGTHKQVVEGDYQGDAYFFARYMAEKHGYVTCTIDPRGMSGYGSLFEKANFERVGKPQVEDLVDGVKHLVANYGVDPKRVGIHGWSFGGFQTQMCLYTQPDVFAVGMAGAGPTEWENYNSWYSTGTIGASRTGQPDLAKFSLLPLAKNLKGHLLLIHGMEDPNVLYQDTVRVYRELLKAGKETLVELFLDPTGQHGLGGDVSRLALARKYEDYLLRYLGKGEPAKPVTAPTGKPPVTKAMK
jgi:dipeptidyl aminopeptidase/acylaminoacyl peptidase